MSDAIVMEGGEQYDIKFLIEAGTGIESLMMQRMSENDGIVTRYMDDSNFQKTIFPILAKEIYKSILEKQE